MPIKARNLDVPFQAFGAVADPGVAGSDVSNQEIWTAPFDLEITKIQYYFEVATSGQDGSNSLVVAAKRNNTGTAIGSKTHTAVVGRAALQDIGTLDDSTKLLAKGDKLTVDVTNGATSDSTDMVFIVTYKPRVNASQ